MNPAKISESIAGIPSPWDRPAARHGSLVVEPGNVAKDIMLSISWFTASSSSAPLRDSLFSSKIVKQETHKSASSSMLFKYLRDLTISL